ncbi:MAG: L,D-transpeptidase family protein [Candidatus Omnitrophota bacterium]|nr:L,D-transpeptidase family protein [Candidatus Omnitrophota bacterium]
MKKPALFAIGVILIVALAGGVRLAKFKKPAGQGRVSPAAADELIYKKALKSASQDKQEESLSYWRDLVDEFPKSKYAGEALFNIGNVRLKEGNLLGAEKTYQRIIRDYPNSESVKKVQQALWQTKINILFSPIKTADSRVYEVKDGDVLENIAKKFNTTVELIKKSNRLTGDFIRRGQRLKISVSEFNVIVDKSLNALTLKTNQEVVKVYTVSTGSPISPTPVGTFSIITKLIDPSWRNLSSDNPKNILGSRWMGFAEPYREYGIHGTTQPESMGKNITKGCVRMLNQDVEELYAILPLGAKVVIIE